jgi:membrane protein DedA with SNARE-associated domain
VPLAGIFDPVVNEIAGPAAYAIVFGIVALDSFFPVAPGETVVITAAVLAQQGELMLWLVFVAAALGAVAGDNVSFWLGDRFGDAAAPKLFRGERSRRGLDWGREQITRRPWVILVARFIPGGRTATTFAAGWLGLPWRRFMLFDVPAALLWSGYSVGVGLIGGASFGRSSWKAIAVALAIAGAITLLTELVRRVVTRRRQRAEG